MRRMTLALGPLAALAFVTLCGCGTSPSDPPPSGGDDDGSTSGAGAGSGSGSGSGGSSSHGSGGGSPGTMGIVSVDIQEMFVDWAVNADLDAVLANASDSFELAGQTGIPMFITYEASKTNDHALHAPLTGVVPSHAAEFIKTTFAATGLASFASAVEQAGVTHWAVMGAETDVCVMQTALGLRQMGFSVLLQSDAVLSSEPNTSPALRRMEQAGISLVTRDDVAAFANGSAALPAASAADVKRLSPLNVAVVLNAFTDANVGATSDPLETQKSARLRELLLVSEWFELPVYVTQGTQLPASYADYFWGAVQPISALSQNAKVDQIVVAGTDAGVGDVMNAWLAEHDVFVVEDALFAMGAAGEQAQLLQPFFAAGLVPTTYKSFYYEMTQSVDVAEWPSQAWVAKYDEYYDITSAPEDLPPMPATP